MTEPAARRRLREAREEATAKRLAAEATDCTMACVMGHTNEPGCLYDTTTSETIPADLMRAAELAAYEALKEDHREPTALWHALIQYAVAAVLPLHEKQVLRRGVGEGDQLLAAATEFTFRPNYGDVVSKFAPDESPEDRDAIVLAYRGPAEEGGDPDRWAIRWRHHDCWSRSKQAFVYEPGGGNRSDDFLADTRFTLDEAVALVPAMLRRLEDVRIPQLWRQIESWATQGAADA